MDVESFLYGLLALCGILLALRTLAFAARIYRSKRWSEPPAYISRSQSNIGAVRATAAPAPRSTSLWSKIVFCGHGLTGKTILAFTVIIAVFGLLTIATVYFALTTSLRRQAIERARVTAVNVSDSAPGFVFKKNFTGLRALLSKYTSRKGMAYILVENRAGEIMAYSFAVVPKEVKDPVPGRTGSLEGPRRAQSGRSDIYEVTVPILEGRIGTVRLGIWRVAIDAEIFQTVMPLIQIIALVIVGGIILAIVLGWQINRPIIRLVNAAKSISHGELDTPSLGLEDTTEFGELSRALERMRSSVKAAMIRLSQER